MTQSTATTTRWSYRIERTDAEPERSCLALGNRDLGPEWDARAFAEEVARENRYAHSYYREGLKVSVWQRGEGEERRAKRTGPCPADAEVFTFGPAEGEGVEGPLRAAAGPVAASGAGAEEDPPRASTEAVVGRACALTSASWYPPVPGDVITVHFEATSSMEAFSECYTVVEVDDGTPRRTELRFSGCNPDAVDVRELCGYFAGPDFADPAADLWVEAGPERLTIERRGRLVHDAPGSAR